MKISMELYTLAERFGDFKAVEMAKEAGFDAIDYSYYYAKECDEILGDGCREYAKKLRAHLDKVGIVCNQAHAPFSFTSRMKADESEEKYRNIVRSIESAAILGAENIIVHSIGDPMSEDFEARNVEYYKSFIPYCEKHGIHVAVENLFSRDQKRHRLIGKIGTPYELNEMVEKIGSPWIVACVDIGHTSLTGYEPQDFISKTDKNILKSLHVQDNSYLEDDHTLPYTGSLDWTAIMTALKKAEYKGDLTFEIIKYVQRFPDELLPHVLKLSVEVGRHLISIYERA